MLPVLSALTDSALPAQLAATAAALVNPTSRTTGYNYDTFAEDLQKLLTHLKLQDFSLVGFSMGAGEIARYVGRYGSRGVSKAVIIGAVPPFLLATDDNPEGVDASVFEGIQKVLTADRYVSAYKAIMLLSGVNLDALAAPLEMPSKWVKASVGTGAFPFDAPC